MSVISIPSVGEVKGVTYFDISVRLPLRVITVSKRYSDFLALVKCLCVDLGISQLDFPYTLPPKAGVFANKSKVVAERKVKLADFLNYLIRDRDLQNSALLHEFLRLPPRFKFTPDFFKDGDRTSCPDNKYLVEENSDEIDAITWLNQLKIVSKTVESLDTSDALTSKVSNREKITKYISPNIEKLSEALEHLSQTGKISAQELRRGNSMLASLQTRLNDPVLAKSLSIKNKNVKMSRRGMEKNSNPAVETPETVDLSNMSLIQKQQMMHLDQDKDLEELRKIIARQRQIGEVINREVEEQSELLDMFTDEVNDSGERLRLARRKVKEIT